MPRFFSPWERTFAVRKINGGQVLEIVYTAHLNATNKSMSAKKNLLNWLAKNDLKKVFEALQLIAD